MAPSIGNASGTLWFSASPRQCSAPHSTLSSCSGLPGSCVPTSSFLNEKQRRLSSRSLGQGFNRLPFVRSKLEFCRSHVFLQVRDVRRARDRQHHWRSLE